MGGCLSTTDRSPENLVKETKKKDDDDEIIRFFMVGMGSAGKSTIIKQLQKLCHTRPDIYHMYDEEWKRIHHSFKEHELQRWRRIIRKNVVDALSVLVKQSKDWELELQSEKSELAAMTFFEDGVVLDASTWENETDTADKILALFLDKTIQDTYDKRAQMTGELQITDGTLYFLVERKLREIFDDNYSPTDDDILHARDPTTGISDYRFSVHNMKVMIHDIGGQKVERAKTVNYINNWVSADRQNYRNFILYVASMPEYNVHHPVHTHMTLLDESIKMLQLILELQPVQNCGVMIFLNKEDVFKDKIKRCKDLPEVRKETIKYLGKYMQKKDQDKLENNGDYSYNAMRKCVAAKFAKVVSDSKVKRNKGVYHRYTCAVDSEMMGALFAAIRNEIINTTIDTADWIP